MFEAKPGSILAKPSRILLDKLQEYCEVNLPNDYLRFLIKYNGAIPVKGSFDCNNHSYFIERFFCLLDNELRDQREDIAWSEIRVVLTEFEGYLLEDEDMTGTELVPIALLFAGNMVCLDFRENPNLPSVCVWDYYESSELSPVTYKAADSFIEFLNMLY